MLRVVNSRHEVPYHFGQPDDCAVTSHRHIHNGCLATVPLLIPGRLHVVPRSLRGLIWLAVAVTGCGEPERITSTARETAQWTVAEESTGLTFRHQTAPAGSFAMPEIMGSGVALLDFDRDGDLDIYFVNLGTKYVPQAAAASEPGRLFRQTQPGEFEDVTDPVGLDLRDTGMGVAAGDANNDGFPDLYLTNFGPDRLLINRQGERFEDVTEAAGILNPGWATSASWCDFDRDGWLDLFVANYVGFNGLTCREISGGRPDYCAPARFQSLKSRLFRNRTGEFTDEERAQGRVKFEDISLSSGAGSKTAATLGAICGDLTGDGRSDIYLANDQEPNVLWVQQADGTFQDEAVLLGVATDMRGIAQGSMGTAAVDLNGDRRLDLLMTNLTGEGLACYLSDPRGHFVESATQTGLRTLSQAGTGFGLGVVDFDHDGEPDLIVANGAVRRERGVSIGGDYWTAYRQPLLFLQGSGGGRFQNVDGLPESFRTARHVSRGLAVGDLDNDGDCDAVVVHIGEKPELFWNTAKKRGRSLQLSLIEPQHGGRDAYGAIVTVTAGERSWTQLLQPGTSYLSSHDPRLYFGLGASTGAVTITVLWPDGVRERFDVPQGSPGTARPASAPLKLVLKQGEGQRNDVAP